MYFCLLSLTRSLALAGDLPGARNSLTELEAERSPSLAVFDPELALVRAWVTSLEGALSNAIKLAHEGADSAARRGQYAHEVLALQTAVCLGDASVAGRLAELTSLVDGPRVWAAAAHAAALSTGDGKGCAPPRPNGRKRATCCLPQMPPHSPRARICAAESEPRPMPRQPGPTGLLRRARGSARPRCWRRPDPCH